MLNISKIYVKSRVKWKENLKDYEYDHYNHVQTKK